MTKKQKELLHKLQADGVLVVCGHDVRTARALNRRGLCFLYTSASYKGRMYRAPRHKAGVVMLAKENKEITNADLCSAFQQTASMCGGDILEMCAVLGEPARIERDGLIDHLSMYGGDHGTAAIDWITNFSGTWEELDQELTRRGVPQYWV